MIMNSDLTCNVPGWEHFPWIVVMFVIGTILMVCLGISNKK